MLGLSYGASFGAGYAGTPGTGSVLFDGTLLGLGVWAAGYLGWLPATGLMPPVWKQRARQVWAPGVEHVVYGLATVCAFRWLFARAQPKALS